MRRRFINSGFGSVDDINNYLTVEALEDGLSISYSSNCYYAIDGGEWRFLIAEKKTRAINIGQTISFKSASTIEPREIAGSFTINKKCNLFGNCLSMLFSDNAKNKYDISGYDSCLSRIFENCPICEVSANFLPATTLADSCYYNMFRNCSNLTIAPVLSATTLTNSCYQGMFFGCTSLTTAPALPATTLASSCYANMFQGCTSLITAPELPVTTLASYCYYSMFEDCTSLTTAPELPATTLANDCYHGMFSYCTNLTTAPALPATTLTDRCYYQMFRNCRKLNYIKMLATDISASSCLYNWVYGVSSTGTFVKNSNMTSLPTGASGIPSGWTVVNDGEDVVQKTVNHGVITYNSNGIYMLTFEYPIACEYMTVDCIPQYWYLVKGQTESNSHGFGPEGLGDTIAIYASNYDFDDYDATNEDSTYIYEVTIQV